LDTKVFTYFRTITSSQPDECGVCFELFDDSNNDDEDFPVKTHCGHILHLSCMRSWDESCKEHGRTLTCPQCRSDGFEITYI